jgi:ribosomal protein RSM22 (predicted rRNA methylase)
MTLVVIRDGKVLEVPSHLVQPLLKIVDKGEKDDFLELVERLPESSQKPETVVVLGKLAGYEIATTSLQTLLDIMVSDAKAVAELVDPLPYQRSLPLVVAIFEKIRPGYIETMADVARNLASRIPDIDVAKKLLMYLGWILDEEG